MLKSMLLGVVAVATVLLVSPEAFARGRRYRSSDSGTGYGTPTYSPSAPASGSGYSYRAYSHQTPDNRPVAVKRAPYSIESNVWRADRKMLQTYWYRD